jgi:hypothetical protein
MLAAAQHPRLDWRRDCRAALDGHIRLPNLTLTSSRCSLSLCSSCSRSAPQRSPRRDSPAVCPLPWPAPAAAASACAPAAAAQRLLPPAWTTAQPGAPVSVTTERGAVPISLSAIEVLAKGMYMCHAQRIAQVTTACSMLHCMAWQPDEHSTHLGGSVLLDSRVQPLDREAPVLWGVNRQRKQQDAAADASPAC